MTKELIFWPCLFGISWASTSWGSLLKYLRNFLLWCYWNYFLYILHDINLPVLCQYFINLDLFNTLKNFYVSLICFLCLWLTFIELSSSSPPYILVLKLLAVEHSDLNYFKFPAQSHRMYSVFWHFLHSSYLFKNVQMTMKDYMYVYHIHFSAWRGQKRAYNSLEPEFYVVVSHFMCMRNRINIIC